MPDVEWPGPRRSVEQLVAVHGDKAVTRACIALLAGDAVDGQIVYALGGPPARWAVSGGEAGPDYWLRVWAMRGLLWHWDDAAIASVCTALSDPAWRVREMAAKVAAKHQVDEALEGLLSLRQDPVARVISAASRAVGRLTAS